MTLPKMVLTTRDTFRPTIGRSGGVIMYIRESIRNAAVTVAAVLSLAGLAHDARAQHLYLDANGDGQSTQADRLSRNGTTAIDVWIQTDRNRDGSAASLGQSDIALSIFSYSLALQSTGGAVKWGPYTNSRATMSYFLGQASSPNEFFVGYGGVDRLAPGRYKLGTLNVQVLSGDPSIEFIGASTIQHGGLTAFGSVNPGRDDDNTLKLAAVIPVDQTTAQTGVGDWTDADGVLSPSGAGALSPAIAAESVPPAFGIKVSSNAGGQTLRFRVTTTKEGPIHIRLFDVSGRLVRTVTAEGGAGAHSLEISPRQSGNVPLGNGIYFYRVTAPDGELTGKVAVLR